MKILIAGAGIVGYNLAQELSHEGHDISIIDQDANRIKFLSEKLDVLAVHGNACRPKTLINAGIRKAEMVIAVTDVDEINIMVCMLAHQFEINNRFARLRSNEFTGAGQVFPPNQLFVDHAVNPGQIMVKSIEKIITTPGAINVADFAEGDILLRGFDVPQDAPLAGKKIGELVHISDMNSFLIVAIVREGNVLIPKHENEICVGDKVYMMVHKEFLPLVLPMVNKTAGEVSKVIIYGAERVAIHLAKRLEVLGIRQVSILEPSMEKAEYAASELNNTVVLHGNGTDPDLHNDINMMDADFFMALSNVDENNILSSLLAKKHGAKRAIVIVNDPDYLPILDSIGMDITINPRLITVSAILQYLRKGQVRSVFKLNEGGAEVLEIEITPRSNVVDKQLNQLKFPEDAILGALVRNKEMIVPHGDTVIQNGDTAVVVTLPGALYKIEKIFGKRRFF